MSNEKKRNAKEIIYKLLLIFMISAVVGFIYEEIFYYIDLGYLEKRGTSFGPWIPIYGFGGLMLYYTGLRFRKHPLAVFLLCSLLCGVLEYSVGWLLLAKFNMRLWDYNTEILNWGNINGFVCFRSVVIFGFAGMFLLYCIEPYVKKVIVQNGHMLKILLFISIICIADISYSMIRAFG